MNEIDTIKQAAKVITRHKEIEGFELTGIYFYTDVEANILYARLRMDKPGTSKWIRPFSRDNTGNWTQLKEPMFKDGKPLYNLQFILKEPDKPVFIVEGEKCADALIKLGLIATTSGGANSAKDVDWTTLARREVWIWADNDQAGERYAKAVKTILGSLNCIIKIVDVSALNLPRKGDCVDWLNRFEVSNKRNVTIKDIISLPLLPNSELGDFISTTNTDYVDHMAFNSKADVSLQCAADIVPEAVGWIWEEWLAKGKLHILAGQAGTGKTTLAMSIATTISLGGYFPDGTKCRTGSVLIWSGEDSPADTLVPRLIAAGADLNKIFFIGDTTTQETKRSFDPSNDMEALLCKAATISDLVMIIIDPIVNAVAGDSHKNGEVRRALQPVVDFGERLKCAVLGITHFSKGGQGKDPLERVTGSLAFGALARIVMATAKIDNGSENTKRIVCKAKSNIGMDNGGFEYEILEKELDGGIASSYVCWGNAINGSARQLLADPNDFSQDNNESSAIDDAKTFLLELLSEGELSHKQIQEDAKGASLSWRTVERAKKALNIKSSKSKTDGRWYWRLHNYIAN